MVDRALAVLVSATRAYFGGLGFSLLAGGILPVTLKRGKILGVPFRVWGF
ncbi:MAG TPA: hypothetical protein GX529_08855 [Firmicutes bacterium]|nr:hypothetical protein [Candidatus Fermentithermobacillaceae bacterium]